MKILVIKGSPHQKGSSNLLAQRFIDGAVAGGHEIVVFDAGQAAIKPCIGCDYCGMNGPCVFEDDMVGLIDEILTSDMMVLVSPLYYFGMSAQLKTVIDRFYSFNSLLTAQKIKSALIVASWDDESKALKDIESHYHTLADYLHFDDQGCILGSGCGTVSMTERTNYPEQAYQFGLSL